MRYVPAIDGLRSLAIGIVIASHYGADRFIPGGFGVTVFFFISGYLITSLMIQEHEKFGSVSISSFYIRRALRLAPALLTMVAIVSLAFFSEFGFLTFPQISAAVLYYMNYYLLSGGHGDLPLGPLWSLAVEEHYYLLFPLVFLAAWKFKERFIFGLAAVAIGILIWRCALVIVWHVGQDRTYIATDTRIDSILFGAILAAIPQTELFLSGKSFDRWPVMIASVALIAITFLYRGAIFRETFRYSLQGLALTPLFYATLFSGRVTLVRNALASPPLVWIGKLSYSLYLWHMPVMFFSERMYPEATGLRMTALDLIITLCLSTASYYTIEKFFQKQRSKFRTAKPPFPATLDRYRSTLDQGRA